MTHHDNYQPESGTSKIAPGRRVRSNTNVTIIKPLAKRGRQLASVGSEPHMEIIMKHGTFLVDARRVVCAFSSFALIAGASAALGQTGMMAADTPAHKAAATSAASPHASMDKKQSNMPGMAAGGDMRSSMMGMMKSMDAMKTTGDTDRDFALMMKVHHQGAIDMAQFELEHGKDPEMRAMAKQIIKAQQKEIADIDRWVGKRK